MYNGIINVYKDAGFTSHDVVAKLRGILKQKKIGHTGTLDPDATGVLPVCLGNATGLCDMLTSKTKEYEAVMLLGTTTDTEDVTGNVTGTHDVTVTDEEIRSIMDSFKGEYEQVPPMYSALKVNGKKLCDLARQGKTVERQARTVNIINIVTECIELPEVKFTVECSKGTYIRSLCRDMGEKAGCGACMKSLVRTRSGIFEIESAHTLDDIEHMQKEGTLDRVIIPTDTMFADCEKITVSGRNEKLVKNGNRFCNGECTSERIRVYFESGSFAGIYTRENEGPFYRPEKMFLSGND